MKKPVYCGTDNTVPKGYSRYGEPYECLRKGIGVGIMISSPEKKVRMIKKMVEKNKDKDIKKDMLIKIATQLNINVYDRNNKVMKKEEILNKIVSTLKKIKI